MSKLEDLAKELATKKHEGQNRTFTKEPYVEHPKRVAEIVREFKSSHKIAKLLSASYLHDTIEDTDTTEEELKKLFGGLVSSLVKELSSDDAEIKRLGKGEYLSQKMIGMSSWALVIKLADRLDNVSDLDKTSDKFRARYTKETLLILDSLEKNRKLSGTQKKLVDKIRGCL